MEQTLQQQWEKVLQSLLEIVQNGLDKAPDYVLDFFNRFQLWVLLDSISLIIIFGVVDFFIAKWFLKTIKREDIDWEFDIGRIMLTILWALAFWTLFILICVNIHDIIQVSIMPELSLIDFLKHYN